MEAALRTVYELVTGKPLDRLEFNEVRGLKGIKETRVKLCDMELSAAVIHGLSNVRPVLEEIREGRSPYQFIEVMCCPGGCIGGGGQPFSRDKDVRAKRMQGLYKEDESLPIRKSHENPAVRKLYEEFLIEPLGHKSHELLHTSYKSRR